MAGAAGEQLGAVAERVSDVGFDFLEGAFVDERTLLRDAGEAVADCEGASFFREEFGELVVDAVLHIDAVGADAGLAGVAEFRDDGAGDGGFDVGIVEDEEGRVAAEFERDALHRSGALGGEFLADRGGAGEGELCDARVFGQHAADGFGVACDDVEHAGREAGFFGEDGESERGIGREFGGFQHDSAASRDAGANLAGDHGGGEVPGRDRANDAHRLFQHGDAAVAGGRRDHVAIGALRLFAEPFEEGAGVGDLAHGFGQRLALFGGHQAGEVGLVLEHQLIPAAQDFGAGGGGLGAPFRQGGLGCGDGGFGFGAAEIWDVADQATRGGVMNGVRRIARPFAVDVALLAEEIGALKRDAAQFGGAVCHDVSPVLGGDIGRDGGWGKVVVGFVSLERDPLLSSPFQGEGP